MVAITGSYSNRQPRKVCTRTAWHRKMWFRITLYFFLPQANWLAAKSPTPRPNLARQTLPRAAPPTHNSTTSTRVQLALKKRRKCVGFRNLKGKIYAVLLSSWYINCFQIYFQLMRARAYISALSISKVTVQQVCRKDLRGGFGTVLTSMIHKALRNIHFTKTKIRKKNSGL